MSRLELIEVIGAAALMVTGLSHWRHPLAWCVLFRRLAKRGDAGARLNGLLHAAVGLLFVATHPVFTGPSALLTYWACAVLAKGLVWIVAPAVGLRSMRALTSDRAGRLRWVGLAMAGLGVLVAGIALA